MKPLAAVTGGRRRRRRVGRPGRARRSSSARPRASRRRARPDHRRCRARLPAAEPKPLLDGDRRQGIAEASCRRWRQGLPRHYPLDCDSISEGCSVSTIGPMPNRGDVRYENAIVDRCLSWFYWSPPPGPRSNLDLSKSNVNRLRGSRLVRASVDLQGQASYIVYSTPADADFVLTDVCVGNAAGGVLVAIGGNGLVQLASGSLPTFLSWHDPDARRSADVHRLRSRNERLLHHQRHPRTAVPGYADATALSAADPRPAQRVAGPNPVADPIPDSRERAPSADVVRQSSRRSAPTGASPWRAPLPRNRGVRRVSAAVSSRGVSRADARHRHGGAHAPHSTGSSAHSTSSASWSGVSVGARWVSDPLPVQQAPTERRPPNPVKTRIGAQSRLGGDAAGADQRRPAA